MTIKDLITKHFPYETFNPGQYEAIEFAVNNIIGGKKHVILQAPTGIGKSAIATTVHRVLREYNNGAWRSTIITATKGLQDQYEAEDSEIYSLKGKTNYPCPIGRDYYMGMGCKTAKSENLCPDSASVCTYLKRRTYWCKMAPLRLTNSSFQIEASTGLVLEEENRANMIVVDECHDIDEHLVKHSTLRVEIDKFENIRKVTDVAFVGYFTEFVNAFLDMPPGTAFKLSPALKDVSSTLLSKIDQMVETLQEKIENRKSHTEAFEGAIDELGSIRDKLDIFSGHSGEWMVTEFGYGTLVELKPVYAYQVAEYALFRKADYFLHMSATICGFEAYKFTLGIKDAESCTMDLPNPIPLKNRHVMVIPKMKVSGDYDRHRLVDLVDAIAKRHPEDNGVIHTVSFTLAKEILDISKNKGRMIVSNNRDEILDVLSRPSKKIILSPSIEKGYDFKNDMCRFQIIAKVPFHYIGDKWVALNMGRDPEWYARKAIVRLVQASGRAVRGVNDYASTYIIDANFERLFKYNKHLFPKWYLDSVSIKT